jgi:hypothetical protein
MTTSLYDIARGAVPFASVVNKYGRNTNVAASGTEDLIRGSATWAAPTAARVHAIVSGSAADVGAKAASGYITVVDWAQMTGALQSGLITVVDYAQAIEAKATGTVTFGTPTQAVKASGTITVIDYAKLAATAAAASITYGSPVGADTAKGTITVTNYQGLIAAQATGSITYGAPTAKNYATGTITVTDYEELKAQKAMAVITIDDFQDLALDKVTIGGVEFVEGTDWDAATSNEATATDLASAIDAHANYEASADGEVITVYVAAAGAAGNSTTIVSSDPGDLIITSTFAANATGRNAATFTVNGVTKTVDSDFNAETDNGTTATNMATALDGISGVGAAAVGAVVTVTADAKGTAGNSIGTTTTAVAGVTMGGATLSGGVAGDTVVVNGNTFTCVVDTPGANEFSSIAELEVLVEAVSGIDSTENGTVVSITATTAGEAGNAITLAVGGGNTGTMSVSGATLSGGQDHASFTLDDVTVVQGTGFTAETSNATTATNLAAALAAAASAGASADGAVVNCAADARGTSGNSINFSQDITTGATISGTGKLANGVNGDTVVVNGTTCTCVVGAAGANQFSSIVELEALTEAVSGINSTQNGTVVSLVAATPGAAGNSLTLALGGSNAGTMAISGATFTGGLDNATITVGTNTLTQGSEFTASTDNATTAESIKTAVAALSGYAASRTGAAVTVKYNTYGTSGNSKQLACSEATGATVSGATLSGGVAGSTLVVDGNTFTCVSETPGAAEFTTITQLEVLVEAVAGVNSSENGTVISVEAAAAGTAGNSITLAKTGNGLTLSGATLSGGRDQLVITIGSDTLTQGTDFTAETSNIATAANIAAAAEALADYTAVQSNATVTVTTVAQGDSALTFTSNNASAATVTVGGVLTGGEDNLTLTLNGTTLVAGTTFTPAISNDYTARVIRDAINAAALGVTASVADNAAVITLTYGSTGTGGNSFTLATNDADSATVSGATLSGGAAISTGAGSVYIEGLDSNYKEISETVVLNGTSSVNTVNSYIMINAMRVTTAGSGGVNAGAITATAATDNTVTSRIAIGQNKSEDAVYQVPVNKSAAICGFYASVMSGIDAEANVELQVKPFGEAWQTIDALSIRATGLSSQRITKEPPVMVSAKGLIKLRAATDTADSDIAGGFDLVLYS